jgi:hypothetical protein
MRLDASANVLLAPDGQAFAVHRTDTDVAMSFWHQSWVLL